MKTGYIDLQTEKNILMAFIGQYKDPDIISARIDIFALLVASEQIRECAKYSEDAKKASLVTEDIYE